MDRDTRGGHGVDIDRALSRSVLIDSQFEFLGLLAVRVVPNRNFLKARIVCRSFHRLLFAVEPVFAFFS